LADTDPVDQVKAKVKKAVLEERIRRAARDQVEKEQSPPELLLRQADSIPAQKLQTLFGGRMVYGAFQLLVGPGESGKGMLSVDLIARLSTGAPFPGEGTDSRAPMKVVMCVTEDSTTRVQARLRAAGASLTNVYFIDGPPAVRGGLIVPSPISFDSDAGVLLKEVQTIGAKALFLETTVEHLGDRERRKQWSTNNEAEVRHALAPIIAVCREGGIIGWGVMHPRKSMEGGIEDSISGSAAFRNAGRGVMHVLRDPKDDADNPWRVLTFSKSNYLAKRPPTLRFRIESWEHDDTEGKVVWGIEGRTLSDNRSAEEIWTEIRDKQKVRKDFTVMDAENLLERILANGVTLPIADIRKAATAEALNWSAIQKAKDKLGVESVKAGYPAMVVGWRLPKKLQDEEI
jgi:hypothetical protein